MAFSFKETCNNFIPIDRERFNNFISIVIYIFTCQDIRNFYIRKSCNFSHNFFNHKFFVFQLTFILKHSKITAIEIFKSKFMTVYSFRRSLNNIFNQTSSISFFYRNYFYFKFIFRYGHRNKNSKTIVISQPFSTKDYFINLYLYNISYF